MAVAMGDVPQQVSFDVTLDHHQTNPIFITPLRTSALPHKFAERLNRRKKAYTTEQLEEKLKLAEIRRKVGLQINAIILYSQPGPYYA